MAVYHGGGYIQRFIYSDEAPAPQVAPATRRQGDVLLIPVEKVNRAKLKPIERDNGRVVLAYGEETGHAHAVLDSDTELFEEIIRKNFSRRVLRVGTDTEITHEEHPPVKLPAGDYEVRQQRQYRPDSEPEWVYD